MKLNYKRTILVGFAFFLISAFWQAYDNIVPLMLVNKFGLNQTWSGFIMALDNVFALFMLPLFGALSDKKETRFGKRTPFIVVGTILAIVCFMSLTIADNTQLQKISQGSAETFWSENYTVTNAEYDSFGNKDVSKEYTIHDYASHILYNKDYDQLDATQQSDAKVWFTNSLNDKTLYSFDRKTDTYTLYQGEAPDGVKTSNAYKTVFSTARSVFASQVTKGSSWVLILFMVLLLATLVSMAIFRSPAVALMPDVTVKPLRSKANAIINLMGTAGGMIVLGLGSVFGTSKAQNQIMSYTGYVIAVCAVMLVALLVFIFTVKEKRWSAQMLDQQALLDSQEEQPQPQQVDTTNEKLPKDKLKSLLLILASVVLWFTGYNAITSKYSLYAVNVLDMDYNLTMLLAQGAAIVAYVPVGIIASKVGRKKTILMGIVLLTLAFTGACFINSQSNEWLIRILFALAGIAWATISVNSFPMVVELAKGNNIGKYTGFYYTASMAAQIITPILSGALMDLVGMKVLFPYGAIFVALSFVTMVFVKHGDSIPTTPKDKLEMLAGEDD